MANGFGVNVGGEVFGGLTTNTMVFLGAVTLALIIGFGGCKK